MDLGLRGRTALVLGGSGGLGKAIAQALAKEGARVAIAGRTQEKLEKTCAEIKADGGEAMPLQWDISDLSMINGQVEIIEQKFGPVQILINNTGGPPPTPAAGQDPALWSKNFQSMVLSVIAITDRILPGMQQKSWGRIITSTSSGIISPIPNLAMSNALRLSLVGWSKTLAREVAGQGITVNVILPGRIATDRLKFLDESTAKRQNRPIEDIQAENLAAIPLGRYGDPVEYGNVVAFFASDRASYVTGSVMRVDGGAISAI